MKAVVMALLALMCFGSSARGQEPDREAKVVNVPEFVMPPDAEAAGIDGKLRISISLDKTGAVKDVSILAGPAWPCGTLPKTELSNVTDAVKQTIRAGTFLPTIKKGKAVEAELFASFAIGQAYQDLLRKREREEAIKAGKPEPKLIKGGVLNGRALKLPKPGYPLEARSLRVGGSVAVETLIDEQGNVVRAGAVSGHPTLQMAARTAACGAKFSPTLLSGQPVKVSGIITYNFVP